MMSPVCTLRLYALAPAVPFPLGPFITLTPALAFLLTIVY